FKEHNRTCFDYSKRMGWYDEITSHIPTTPRKRRTYEEVCEAAKKYNTRMEFKNSDMANYSYAVSYGWIDNVCSHMSSVGDLFKRCVYSYEFPNKVCYVGLTYDLDKRDIQHRNPDVFSSARRYCEETGVDLPLPKMLTDYITSDEASKKEGEIVMMYKNLGWKCLNVAKTGGLGGCRHNFIKSEITKEFCIEKAKEFPNITAFHNKHQNLYNICKNNGWLDELKNKSFDMNRIRKEKAEKLSMTNKGRFLGKRGDNSKSVIQYRLDGSFIAEFKSQAQAANELGHPKSSSDIGKCCNGKLKTCLGFMWRYK
ncbi:MAG: hypothetical protein J6O49_21990, partial [Bacteroidaceae bacterium]|nr:hypothetical protein [Bacteroidaceae bacterium]